MCSCSHLLMVGLGLTGMWMSAIVDLMMCAACLTVWRWRPIAWRWSIGGIVVGVGVLLSSAAMFQVHRAVPLGAWDAMAIWNLKATFLYRGGPRWSAMFSDVLASSHPDYPLLLPLNVARLWRYAGYDWLAPALLNIVVAAGLAMLLYSLVRQLRGTILAILATLALLGTRQWTDAGASQLADLPLGLYLLGSLGTAMLALRKSACPAGFWLLSGFLAGAAAWTKNEGWLFVIALFAALLAVRLISPRVRWRSWLAGAALPLLLVLIVKASCAGRSDLFAARALSQMLDQAMDVQRYAMIGRAAAGAVVLVVGWPVLTGIALALLGAAGTTRTRDRAPQMLIALTLFLVILGYGAVYLISPHDLAWHLHASAHRLLLQLWPSVLLAVAMLLSPSRVKAAVRWKRPARPVAAR
ncbi:MAG: hypothetical protein IT440_12935 [Phycisphaeraceae bacterium]|nr:hypothetical protein [Phycisphaeraceae bacterium]